jgi:TfoX/Sxy family transcriptional regulator of competence genes
MKPYEATQYLAAGCEFATESPRPFLGVHGLTQGRVCDTGCAWYANAKCPAFKRLTALPAALKADPVETVRQEAARRGLSINEVRRQRAAFTK